jgi:hypothetical protein
LAGFVVVNRLNAEIVIFRTEISVGSRSPLPVDGETWRVTGERALPDYVLNTSWKAALAGTANLRPARKSLPASPEAGSAVLQPMGLPISGDSLAKNVVASVIELDNVTWESGTVSW